MSECQWLTITQSPLIFFSWGCLLAREYQYEKAKDSWKVKEPGEQYVICHSIRFRFPTRRLNLFIFH